ncbi:MAG: hypothetical protein ACRYG8_25555, partial [Janthinobacterium lividum]
VLMIGSCLSERFLEFTRQDRPDVTFDFILFNYAGELPSSLPAPASEYDFQYVQIPLRSVITDRVIHAVQLNSAEFVSDDDTFPDVPWCVINRCDTSDLHVH